MTTYFSESQNVTNDIIKSVLCKKGTLLRFKSNETPELRNSFYFFNKFHKFNRETSVVDLVDSKFAYLLECAKRISPNQSTINIRSLVYARFIWGSNAFWRNLFQRVMTARYKDRNRPKLLVLQKSCKYVGDARRTMKKVYTFNYIFKHINNFFSDNAFFRSGFVYKSVKNWYKKNGAYLRASALHMRKRVFNNIKYKNFSFSKSVYRLLLFNIHNHPLVTSEAVFSNIFYLMRLKRKPLQTNIFLRIWFLRNYGSHIFDGANFSAKNFTNKYEIYWDAKASQKIGFPYFYSRTARFPNLVASAAQAYIFKKVFKNALENTNYIFAKKKKTKKYT